MKLTLTLAFIALCCIIYHLVNQPTRARRQITYDTSDIVRLNDGKTIVGIDEATGKEIYVWQDRYGVRHALVDGSGWSTK